MLDPHWFLTQMETPCLHQGGSLSVWIRTAVRTLGRHRLYSMAKEWKEARTWLANQLLNPIQVDTMYIGESRLKVRLEREGGVFINGCGLDPNLMQPSLSVLVRALQWSLLLSLSVMSSSLRPHGLQHARLPCPSPSSRACSNSCPLSR